MPPRKKQSCTSTGTKSKKTQSKTTSTAKAKAKSTTKSSGKTTTTPKKRKTQPSKPSVKNTTPRKRKATGKEEIKFTRSRDKKLFPWSGTFPWRLEDRKENKTCWFQCFEHAEKYIRRYCLTSRQFKLQECAVE